MCHHYTDFPGLTSQWRNSFGQLSLNGEELAYAATASPGSTGLDAQCFASMDAGPNSFRSFQHLHLRWPLVPLQWLLRQLLLRYPLFSFFGQLSVIKSMMAVSHNVFVCPLNGEELAYAATASPGSTGLDAQCFASMDAGPNSFRSFLFNTCIFGGLWFLFNGFSDNFFFDTRAQQF